MSSTPTFPAAALALNARIRGELSDMFHDMFHAVRPALANASSGTMNIRDNEIAAEYLRKVAQLLEQQNELATGASSSVKTANKEVQVSTDIAADEAAKKAAEEKKQNDIETRLLQKMGKVIDEKLANAAETRKKEEADKKAAKKASQAKRQRERSSSDSSSSFDPAELEEQRRKIGKFDFSFEDEDDYYLDGPSADPNQPSTSSYVAPPTAALPTGAQSSKRTGISFRQRPQPSTLAASDILRDSRAGGYLSTLKALAAGTSGDSAPQPSTGKRGGSTTISRSMLFAGRKVAVESEVVRQMGERGKMWMTELEKFPVSSPNFVKEFAKGEHMIQNEDLVLETFPDSKNYVQKLGSFRNPVLFKSSDDLEMNVPQDLNWDTLEQFVDLKKKIDVIYSYTKETVKMTWKNFLKIMRSSDPDAPAVNLLSLEFSSLKTRLNEFKQPTFVSEMSIVTMVEEELKRKAEELETQKTANKKVPKMLDRKLKKIQYMVGSMPRYEKFFLVSKKNSFTDIHVDPSGTAVFYHVLCGRKIFYLARNTEQNLEFYRKSEIRESEGWLGKKLLGEFQRLEIGPGETAMIPSGWLHFVYTPEDSLVIGGNFLMENSISMQFKMTEIEEAALKAGNISRSQMFVGFNNVMWAYAELVVLGKLRDPVCPNHVVVAARELLKLLPSEKETGIGGGSIDWYHTIRKSNIKKELESYLGVEEGEEEAEEREPGPSQEQKEVQSGEPQAKKFRKE